MNLLAGPAKALRLEDACCLQTGVFNPWTPENGEDGGFSVPAPFICFSYSCSKLGIESGYFREEMEGKRERHG